MKNFNQLLACLVVTVACLAGMSRSAYASVAGHVQFVHGNVQITNPAGQAHQAQKGDAVSEGDTLTSLPSSSAQIKMLDGGFVAMRPDTKLKFDQFVFSGKQDGSEKSFFSLAKGGFRAITGLVGQVNKQNYRINTPAATIGIRGTDHETFLIAPGSPLAQIAPTGAYSKVNVGETTLTTDKGTINVMPNQMGFAGGLDQAPKLQPVNTSIFTVATASTSGAKAEKKEEKKEEGAEAKQEQKTAKSEEKQEEDTKDSKQADKASGEAKGDAQATKQEGATTESKQAASTSSGQAADTATTTSIRSAAATDSIAPSAGLIQGPASPVTAPPIAIAPPPDVLAPTPTPTTADGTKVNLTTGTATTTAGQVIVVTQTATAITPAVLAGGPFAAVASNNTSIAYGFNDGSVQSSNGYQNNFLTPPGNITYTTGAPTTAVDPNNCNSGCTTTTTLAGYAQTLAPTTVGATSIQYGAGTVTSLTHTQIMPLGAGSWSPATWMYGSAGYLDTPTTLSATVASGAVTGVFSYTPDGVSLPYDVQSKLRGTINSATVSANFVTNVVAVDVNLTMGADVWTAGVTTGITGNFFSSTNISTTRAAITKNAVACAGSTCNGTLAGAFTGQNYAGLMLSYQLNDFATGQNIAGNGAFVRDTTVAVTNGAPVAASSYFVANQGGFINSVGTVNNLSVVGASPFVPGVVLTSSTSAGGGNTFSSSATCTTCTVTPATNVASTGIYFGTWDAGTYTNTNVIANPAGGVSWITGAQTAPPYLAWALTGTANYNLAPVAAAGADNLGNTLTAANLTSATLSANFTNQTVAVALGISLGGNVWTASTTASLQGRGNSIEQTFFNASTYNSAGTNLLTMTVTGSGGGTAPANGYISGQLVGADLSGALLNYAFTTPGFSAMVAAQNLSGVAAFSGPAQSAATSYQMVGASFSSGQMGPSLGVGFDAPSRVTVVAGGVTAADMQFVNNKSGSMAVAIGTNTNTDLGNDPVSGISWGRWAGGTADVIDRATASVVAGGGTSGSGIHWIGAPVASGPVTLPVSGTFTYTYAGGTLPTDNLGNVGTLNSATLSADFTAQTVNVSVDATVATTRLVGTASAVPIMSGAAFDAGPNSSVPLSVSCLAGACGAAHQGQIVGGFSGAGAAGAAMMYSLEKLNATGVNTGSIHGVAAFHR